MKSFCSKLLIIQTKLLGLQPCFYFCSSAFSDDPNNFYDVIYIYIIFFSGVWIFKIKFIFHFILFVQLSSVKKKKGPKAPLVENEFIFIITYLIFLCPNSSQI